MRPTSTIFVALAVLGCLLFDAERRAHAFELITTYESTRPDDETGARGVTRGPQIVVTSPPPTAGLIRSPFNLKIRFVGRGGVKVDPDSVVVSYKKRPLIDLTQRCAPFITATGIMIDGATAPPGTHTIRVDLKDLQGRSSWSEFSFQIAQ